MKVDELSKEIQKEVVKLYKKGISVNDIAKNDIVPFTSPHSIIKILQLNNIEIRNRGGYRPPFKENYFNVIDSEAKAYFLGLLTTDGSINLRKDSQPCISLELQSDDIEILKLFKKELKANNKVEKSRVRGTGIHSRFRVHSTIMANDLKQFGVVPNKTLKTFLPNLDKRYMPHYIRGVIDGDGWIQSSGISKGIKRRIGCCSASETFINQLNTFLYEEIGVSIRKVYRRSKKKNHDIFSILYCGEQDVKRIINYLYKNATVYLSRKHHLIKDFIDE